MVPLGLPRCRIGLCRSGRPDLNRGPPAPKAGAIPGYATPRGEGKLLYPAGIAQRSEERAKCATAMTGGGRSLQGRLGERSAQIGRLEIWIVAEATVSAGRCEHAPFDHAAAQH